ncbi:GNAT family N-acetyltransferase [Sphingobacterium detergens]
MILETERLILRPFRDADAADLFKYAKDERVGPIAGWPPHKSVEESSEVIKNIFSQDGVFAITLKEDDIAIGMISLILGEKSNFPITESEGEISYWLGVPFWGKGIMPEAIGEVVRYGFEDLRLVNIWSGYYEGNAKSKIAQEKCGFHHHHVEEASANELMNDIRTEHISRMTRDEWTMAVHGKVSF